MFAVLLLSGVVFAKPRTKAECEQQVKEFTVVCEKQACEKVGQKDPSKKASCQKSCQEQEALLQKACASEKGK
jgi:hypothetical protein